MQGKKITRRNFAARSALCNGKWKRAEELNISRNQEKLCKKDPFVDLGKIIWNLFNDQQSL